MLVLREVRESLGAQMRIPPVPIREAVVVVQTVTRLDGQRCVLSLVLPACWAAALSPLVHHSPASLLEKRVRR